MGASIKDSEKETADLLIKALEKPVDGNWIMPWDRSSDGPNNPTTGKSYGGGYNAFVLICLLYTSPSPRDGLLSRMPSSA